MALHNRRDGNREAIQAFANQFDPPLNVAQTRAVGGVAVTNGWQAALHDPEIELGITAVVWGGGHFKVWMELQGTAPDAGELGAFFAAIVREAHGMADPEEPEVEELKVAESMPDVYRAPMPFWNNKGVIPPADGVGGPVEVPLEKRAEFPNPQLINMMELRQQERLDLVTKFPELEFFSRKGVRYRMEGGQEVQDDRAGFCNEEQLKAVRATCGMAPASSKAGQHLRDRLARLPVTQSQPVEPAGGIAMDQPLMEMPELKPMGAPPKPNCDHRWERNSIGDGETCSKCGGFQRVSATRSRQAAINAERREQRAAVDLEARLRRMAEAKVRCETEPGQHSYVTIEEDGRQVTVCQFCGTEEPAKETAVLDDPEGAGEPSGRRGV